MASHNFNVDGDILYYYLISIKFNINYKIMVSLYFHDTHLYNYDLIEKTFNVLIDISKQSPVKLEIHSNTLFQFKILEETMYEKFLLFLNEVKLVGVCILFEGHDDEHVECIDEVIDNLKHVSVEELLIHAHFSNKLAESTINSLKGYILRTKINKVFDLYHYGSKGTLDLCSSPSFMVELNDAALIPIEERPTSIKSLSKSANKN